MNLNEILDTMLQMSFINAFNGLSENCNQQLVTQTLVLLQRSYIHTYNQQI